MWGIVVVLGGGNRSSLLEIELLVMDGLGTLKMRGGKQYLFVLASALTRGVLSRHRQSC